MSHMGPPRPFELAMVAIFVIALVSAGCGVAGPPTNQLKGSGGRSGFGGSSEQTPSERSNSPKQDAAAMPVLSRPQQDALQRTDVVAAIADIVYRACVAGQCGTDRAVLQRAAEAQLAAIDDVRRAARYLPVEAAGRSTTAFEAVRRRLEQNPVSGREGALRAELMAA